METVLIIEASSSMLHRLKKILSIIFVLLMYILLLAGCRNMLAEELVKAPNSGKSAKQLADLSQSQLKKWQIDQQLRVEVDSPPASLHIGIIEPKKEWAINSGNFWYDALQDPYLNIAKQHPEIKMPEVLYWNKFPEDRNDGNTGLSFSEKAQEDQILWKETKGTFICLHGLHMDKTIFAISWGHIFAAHGYRVILVDLRGHGKSTGDYLTYGRIESVDVSQVIDYPHNSNMLTDKLIIMGGSYGSAVAIQAAAIDSRIDAVIAMEPFTSLKEAAPDFAKERLGLFAMLIGKRGIKRIVDRAGKIANFDPDNNTPLEAVKQINIPILFLHGRDDKHIPYRHSQELNDATCCGKIIIVDGKNHMNLAFEDIYPIRDEIIDWLEDEKD
jgi:pimeloyl-ACP methyl ester carboxylesterase